MTNRNTQDIEALRAHLFAAIEGVKSNTLDLDKARAINELGKTLVDTARVEVEFIKITDGEKSKFLAPAGDEGALPAGITGRTIHRIAG